MCKAHRGFQKNHRYVYKPIVCLCHWIGYNHTQIKIWFSLFVIFNRHTIFFPLHSCSLNNIRRAARGRNHFSDPHTLSSWDVSLIRRDLCVNGRQRRATSCCLWMIVVIRNRQNIPSKLHRPGFIFILYANFTNFHSLLLK